MGSKGGKALKSGCVLETAQKAYPDGLDLKCEQNRKLTDDSKDLAL